MRFTPKTEDEIAKDGLIADGIYGFEVMEAEDKISKQGNDMIYAKLKVFDGEGGFRYVDDYLMEKMLGKLKHCMDACGLTLQYERGSLDASDMIGRTGEVRIVTQQDKDKLYPPRNVVKDYVLPKAGATQAVRSPARKPAMASAPADPFDDEIPF